MKEENNNFIEPFKQEKEDPKFYLFKRNLEPVFDPLKRVSISEETGEVIIHDYKPGFLEATKETQELIDKTILRNNEKSDKKEN